VASSTLGRRSTLEHHVWLRRGGEIRYALCRGWTPHCRTMTLPSD